MFKQPRIAYTQLHLIVAGTFAALCLSSNLVMAQSTVVEDVFDAVVKITAKSHGAGFFIDDEGLILTNYHVVKGDRSPEVQLYSKGNNQKGETYTGQVIHDDEGLDLALIKINYDSTSKYLSLASGDTPLGLDLFLVGHPVTPVTPENEKHKLSRSWAFQEGDFTGNVEEGDDDYKGDDKLLLRHNIKIHPGNSGGPLARMDDGSVVGVVNEGYLDTSTLYYAIRSDVVLNWLSKLNIELPLPIVRKPASVPDTPRNSDKSFYLGIATGRDAATYSSMGNQLKSLLDDYSIDLSVVTNNTTPSTNGSITNVNLLNEDGCCQLAFVQSDVLQHYEQSERLKDEYTDNLRFLFPLHTEEVHVLARKDIKSFDDLKKLSSKIAVDGVDTGTYITANAILSELGFEQDTYVYKGSYEALGMLIARDVDAMFYVAGYPANLFTKIESEELHLLKVGGDSLNNIVGENKLYQPSFISNKYYDGWLKESVPTVSVRAVLMTYNYRKDHCWAVRRFASVVEANYDKLLGRENRYWEKANFNEKAPIGWTRFDPEACIQRSVSD